MIVRQLLRSEPIPYQLLFLADPSKEMIDLYFDYTYTYVADIESQIVGVLVLYPLDNDAIEIKNIAVVSEYQEKGIGTALLSRIFTLMKNKGFTKLIIGTANTSIIPLQFYQKMGFKICSIKKNFFIENYSEPIFEDGNQCVDLIMLEKYI